MIDIVVYKDKYKEDVKDLLEKLQDYHDKIDEQNIMTSVSNYKEEYFKLIMNLVKEKEGKIFLAIKEKEREQSIGGSLLEQAEAYLKSINCKYIDIKV